MKVFFATDIHGSEICWRKFLNAAAFYKADMVILGGDVTGKVLVPILALGLPLMEVVLTLLRRTFVSGVASIFHADREHIHHRLMGQGMTHRRAVLTLYAVCVAFGALSFVAVAVQGLGNAVVVGVAGAAMYAGIRALGYRAPRREMDV